MCSVRRGIQLSPLVILEPLAPLQEDSAQCACQARIDQTKDLFSELGLVMDLQFVPLLQIQRDLLEMPRGVERFRKYLRVILNSEGNDAELVPLILMNPMAKDHVAHLLDKLVRLNGEAVGAEAAREASVGLAGCPDSYRVGLVLADDAMGGWTNRYASEFSLICLSREALRRGWLSAVLWSSEEADTQKVREAVLMTACRAAYLQTHGAASTLRDLLAQEGWVLSKSGCQEPTLEQDDLAYTRDVIGAQLEASDQPTLVACLFGDRAALALGYPPQGLRDRAGLALALHEARS